MFFSSTVSFLEKASILLVSSFLNSDVVTSFATTFPIARQKTIPTSAIFKFMGNPLTVEVMFRLHTDTLFIE
jgi:hypothetical protein